MPRTPVDWIVLVAGLMVAAVLVLVVERVDGGPAGRHPAVEQPATDPDCVNFEHGC